MQQHLPIKHKIQGIVDKCTCTTCRWRDVYILEVWTQRECVLTGKPCVMGSSILKRRILALNLVQALMGSLGSQNIHPMLEKKTWSYRIISAQRKFSNQVLCNIIKILYNHRITVYSKERNAFNSSDSRHTHFILIMSMPVTVRLTWSPAAAQSNASSWRVIPGERERERERERRLYFKDESLIFFSFL